jgi:hypothetical protein
MATIIDEVPSLYRVIQLDPFRSTPGVTFDLFPMDALPRIDSIDRVIHNPFAQSPGPVGTVERPWYMHEFQDDNLIVLHGRREVEIYTPRHGRIEHFSVTPQSIRKNGTLLVDGGAILVWPSHVFHRIISGEEGSASINLAVRYPGFDIHSNFNIYDLDPGNGWYQIIRKGSEDQQPV